MGWSFIQKPDDVRRYFWDQLTWDTDDRQNRCIGISLKLNVCYAAVETTHVDTGESEVWAAVTLVKYVRNPADGCDFGYKSMTDSCGPVLDDCPASILDLLTETDNENANDWRARCRRNLTRKMPKIGTRVRFALPITFQNGAEEAEFQVVRYGRRKVLRGASGGHFRVNARLWRDRDWSVLETP